MMSLVVGVAIAIASLPVLAWAGYLFVLTLLSKAMRAPSLDAPKTRFDVVVPAHDEEDGIAATVASLLSVDYPRELFRVIVVADNCSDATAARAEAAGAKVLVRVDQEKRGKGYALAHAFETGEKEAICDAFVVVDADTTASPNLLRAFAARIEAGASSVQAEYGVRNARASWRTRLMVIALALFHGVRSLARERMRVSCGLRGNGMAFTRALLREVPHDAFSIVEDVEYGIRLGRAGHRVWYAHEAQVLGEMVSSEKASRSQRERWEGGRWALAKANAPALFADAFKKRSLMLFDLAMDIVVPPLTYLVLSAAFGLVVSIVWTWAAAPYGMGASVAWIAVAAWAAASAFVACYVVRGIVVAGLGFAGVLDLMWAPVYMIWKVWLMVRGRGADKKREWVRTAREKTP